MVEFLVTAVVVLISVAFGYALGLAHTNTTNDDS